MIAEQVEWMPGRAAATVSQLLSRLGIHYKRGREYVHSPDRHYGPKVDLIEQMRQRAYDQPAQYAFLYLDELTFYRQPSVARAYEAQGSQQPLAYRSHKSNTASRILGTLDALTGQVLYRQRSRTTIPCFTGFWYEIYNAYAWAETIYIVVDNWPVHFHPDVLAPLQTQHLPWPPTLPANWSTEPSANAQHDNLPIQLLCLPTYASWLNPIEKLWRWLRQDILHLHRLAHDWPLLTSHVNSFLDRFALPSDQLLRYVGHFPI